MKRRGFLKLLGAATAAVPGAAAGARLNVPTNALAARTLPLAGIATGAADTLSGFGGVADAPGAKATITRSAMRAMGLIPDWLTRQWDEEAMAVDELDVDIAQRHFMSLPAKIALQRKRNRKRVEEEWFKTPTWLDQHRWSEKHGNIER